MAVSLRLVPRWTILKSCLSVLVIAASLVACNGSSSGSNSSADSSGGEAGNDPPVELGSLALNVIPDFGIRSGEARELWVTVESDGEPALTYEWVQVDGPPALLNTPDEPVTLMTTPVVNTPEMLTFALAVTDGAGFDYAAEVRVLARPMARQVVLAGGMPAPGLPGHEILGTGRAGIGDGGLLAIEASVRPPGGGPTSTRRGLWAGPPGGLEPRLLDGEYTLEYDGHSRTPDKVRLAGLNGTGAIALSGELQRENPLGLPKQEFLAVLQGENLQPVYVERTQAVGFPEGHVYQGEPQSIRFTDAGLLFQASVSPFADSQVGYSLAGQGVWLWNQGQLTLLAGFYVDGDARTTLPEGGLTVFDPGCGFASDSSFLNAWHMLQFNDAGHVLLPLQLHSADPHADCPNGDAFLVWHDGSYRESLRLGQPVPEMPGIHVSTAWFPLISTSLTASGDVVFTVNLEGKDLVLPRATFVSRANGDLDLLAMGGERLHNEDAVLGLMPISSIPVGQDTFLAVAMYGSTTHILRGTPRSNPFQQLPVDGYTSLAPLLRDDQSPPGRSALSRFAELGETFVVLFNGFGIEFQSNGSGDLYFNAPVVTGSDPSEQDVLWWVGEEGLVTEVLAAGDVLAANGVQQSVKHLFFWQNWEGFDHRVNSAGQAVVIVHFEPLNSTFEGGVVLITP